MINTVVLGIGNRLLMDDGIGLYVAEALKELSTGDIHCVIGETDIDYCLDEVKGAEFLIIIDAAKLGKASGEVTVLDLDDVKACRNLGLSMHNLRLFNMVELIYKDIKGIMIGIEPYMIDYNLGLSEEISIKLPEILTKVRNIVNQGIYQPFHHTLR
ncbi:MAG: hydrogenase maturation protease [Clostridiaceae bacterium]